VESNLQKAGDIPSQQIKLLIDGDDIETSAFGINYGAAFHIGLKRRPIYC
jgi:hypothetical protein